MDLRWQHTDKLRPQQNQPVVCAPEVQKLTTKTTTTNPKFRWFSIFCCNCYLCNISFCNKKTNETFFCTMHSWGIYSTPILSWETHMVFQPEVKLQLCVQQTFRILHRFPDCWSFSDREIYSNILVTGSLYTFKIIEDPKELLLFTILKIKLWNI